jgi:hypothetical protein
MCLAKRRIVHVGWWVNAYHSYLSGKDGICFSNGFYHPHTTDKRANEANPVIFSFFEKLMPIFYGDLLLNIRLLRFDFAEFVLMKALIFFRDEFFLSDHGLKMVGQIRARYASALYKYILQKCEGDFSATVIRYTEMLNLIPSVLYLTVKMNERIELSSFFGILDFDGLVKDVHNSGLLTER